MKAPLNVAVVGATGAVGQKVLSILEERRFPVGRMLPFASARSAGKRLLFNDLEVPIQELSEGCFKGVDIAFFAAGGAVSETWAPLAAREGAVVIDKSSVFRQNPEVPLVVPEVNRQAIFRHRGIIATPNCSTIQMVVALKPLLDAADLRRLVVSTYQATSGAGAKGPVELMDSTRAALEGKNFSAKTFAHPIGFNAVPHIDAFMENGWTKEEMKMVWETHKIFEDDSIPVAATCVRIPVVTSHSESICAEFKRPISVEEVLQLWKKTPGILVVNDPSRKRYPMPVDAADTDPVYVGRLRQDLDDPNTIHFWCVSDNLRKGAALNAVQIAECLLQEK